MIPAVLLWLSWQHRRLPREIVALGGGDRGAARGRLGGANGVHDHYYGPTHADSAAPDIPVDRVEWVWAGGLTADEHHDHRPAGPEVANRPGWRSIGRGGPSDRSPTPSEPDRFGTVRFDIDGLDPDTEYRYRLRRRR